MSALYRPTGVLQGLGTPLWATMTEVQLSGLKGVNPPVKFGERTRDCSPAQAGKEGPHLSLTGASCGFSRTAVPLWVFSRGTIQSGVALFQRVEHDLEFILSLAQKVERGNSRRRWEWTIHQALGGSSCSGCMGSGGLFLLPSSLLLWLERN